MSPSTKKTAASAAKAPAKRTQAAVPATKTPAKTPARMAPAKVPAKVAAKAPAKTAAKKVSAKAPAKKTSREAMLARVEAVRMEQRSEGHFDCFGRAGEGYCDQGACSYHAECLSVSRLLHSL
jgi:hypothetical protein